MWPVPSGPSANRKLAPFAGQIKGHVSVSTNDQETATQVAALKATGCERIYREKASGGRWDRPELHRLLDQLRKGDVLVVWKLDWLSRSLRDVLTIMERPSEAGAGFRSLTEAIDTTTPAGRMMMQMVWGVRRVRTGYAPGKNKGGPRFRPSGRTHRWAPSETVASTTGRDQEDGFQRPQDGKGVSNRGYSQECSRACRQR